MAKKYSDTFKESVVQKVRDGARAVDVARESGASVYSVRDWLKKADEQSNEGPLTMEEKAEIKRLRRENRELTLQCEILKKATAYFVQGPT